MVVVPVSVVVVMYGRVVVMGLEFVPLERTPLPP